MNEIEEAYKTYHHTKAAFERVSDEWLDALDPNDLMFSASSEVVRSFARLRFPDELEAVRVAAIQLDVLREARDEEMHAAALEAHRAATALLKEQTAAWFGRARVEQILAEGLEARAS